MLEFGEKDKDTDAQGFVRNVTHKSDSASWGYAIASCFLVAMMVVPQFSAWVESQTLVKSIQSLVRPQQVPTSLPHSLHEIGFPIAIRTPVTSEFGWRIHPITGERKFHSGMDFGAAEGSPIYAVDAGRVESAGERGGYGNAVVIRHNARISTLYGHTSQLYVTSGQWVQRGQMIAAVGSTGLSTGPHLHFEVQVNGVAQNPRPYLHEYLANR
jgi:murein DD-endopeptidase MepM/ murein hydrolase activator NlpD